MAPASSVCLRLDLSIPPSPGAAPASGIHLRKPMQLPLQFPGLKVTGRGSSPVHEKLASSHASWMLPRMAGCLPSCSSSLILPSSSKLVAPTKAFCLPSSFSSSSGRPREASAPRAHTQHQQGHTVTASEEAAWRRRQEESLEAAEEESRSVGDSDHWRWTLNWSGITPELLVGSCPRSASDIDTLFTETGITAIVNLQSDVCFDALQIPFPEIKQRAIERGIFLARVPVRDFDHCDQAAMLPEAVRVVNMLVTRGHKVYVHCTAGINRAPLVVLAFLYFVQGLRRDEAIKMVKLARPVANPYLDCLTEAKKRLLEGRDEELTALATEIYEQRCNGQSRGDASSDWSGAQARALARSFTKYLEVDLGLLDTERELAERRWRQEMLQGPKVPEGLQVELEGVKELVEEKRAKIAVLMSLVRQWEQEEAAAAAKAAELEATLQSAVEAHGKAEVGDKGNGMPGRARGSEAVEA